MNIIPKGAAPEAAQPNAAQSARDRAIAKFMGSAENQTGVNQNSVSPEELSAASSPAPKAPVQQEAPKQEAAPEPTNQESTPEKSKEPPLSSQYAILARKEKALRLKAQQQEQAIREKEAAIAAKEAEIRAKEAEYQTRYIPKDALEKDIVQTLLDNGVTYDQITEKFLNAQQQDPYTKAHIAKLEAKIAQLEEAQSKTVKTFEEQQTQSYQQAVNQIRSEVKNLVNSDPNFELTKHTNSVDDVVELIEKVFKEDGVLLTPEEATLEIENYLEDRAVKLSKLNKVQRKLQPSTKPAPRTTGTPTQKKAPEQPQQQPLKTLTNATATTGKLSARQRAILAFEGKLQK